jgi:hypothetical protein
VFKHGDFAVALPEFNIVAVNKLFRLFRRLGVVGAFNHDRIHEMTFRLLAKSPGAGPG